MALLTLALRNPAIANHVNGRFYRGWSLSYDIGLSSWRDEVELTTGGDFGKLKGKLTLRVGQRDGDALGSLFHMPASKGSPDGFSEAFDERFGLLLVFTEDELMRLIDAERDYGARLIQIESEGLKYGWAPDGSQLKWDNAEKPTLSVESASFTYGDAPEDEDDQEPDESEPVADEGNPAMMTQRAIEAMQGDIAKLLPMVVGVLVLILGVLLYRSF